MIELVRMGIQRDGHELYKLTIDSKVFKDLTLNEVYDILEYLDKGE